MSPQEVRNGAPMLSESPVAEVLGSRFVLGQRLTLVLVSAIVVMMTILISPMFHHRIPVHGDLGNFNLPMRHFYSECMKHGESFGWFSGIFCGYFLTGEGQHGPYHPIHWLMYRWLPLEIAWDTEVFLPVVVLVAGMLVFLRRYVDFASACLGALATAFSMKFVGILQHPQMAIVLAHLPWLLASIDLAVVGATPERQWWGGGFIALTVGSAVLLGHPQACWIILFIGSLFAVWRLFMERNGWRAWIAIAVGMSLGLCLGAVQLFATYDLYTHTGRVNDTAVDSARQTISTVGLYGVVAPFITPFPEDYFGVVPLLLSLWWLTAYRIRLTEPKTANETGAASLWHSDRLETAVRRISLWTILLVVVTAWLAMGQEGGLYYLVLDLPIVGKFRVPFRFMIGTQILVGILTALAFSRLMVLARTRRTTGWGHLVLPWCVVGITIAMAVAWAEPDADNPLRCLFQGPSHSGIWLMVIGAIGLTLAVRGQRLGLWILAILAIYDVSIYSVGNSACGKPYWRKLPTYEEFLATYPGPPGPPQGRIYENNYQGNQWMWVNRQCLLGHRLVTGYTGLARNLTLDYHHINSLRVAEVHWWRDPNSPVVAGLGLPVGENWRPVPSPLPRVRLVSSVHVSENPREDLKHIDIENIAILSRPVTLDSSTPGDVQLISDRPGHICIEAIAPARQLLVVSEGYHHEWQVQVDGQHASVERVNGDFMGCVVDKGKHYIEFTFSPKSVRLGGVVSLVAFACVGLVGFCRYPASRLLKSSLVTQFHERTLIAGIVVAILIMASFFASPLFLGHVPVQGDLGNFNLPARHFYAQCLQRGDAFDWTPQIFGGLFLTGEGQHGPYHPLHWLMYRFLPLDKAFALEVFLPVVIMGTGMYFFLRRYLGYAGACLGTLLFTFSMNFVHHIVHVQMATVLAHIPWVLGMMDIAVTTSNARHRWLAGAAIAMLTGSQILLGHPHAFWHSLCAEGVFVVFLWIYHRPPWKAWIALAGGMGMGVCLGAVQLLATYSFYATTERSTCDAAFANSYAHSFQTYLGVVAPCLLFSQPVKSLSGVYFGTVPLLLSLWWIGFYVFGKRDASGLVDETREKNIRRLTFFSLALSVLAIWLSLGFSGKLYYLHWCLPVVGKFRCPHRFSLLAGFCFAALSGIAFSRLAMNLRLRQKLPWKTLLLPVLLFLFAVAMAFWYGSGRFTPSTEALEAQCFAGPVLVGVGLASLALAVRGHPFGLFLLVVVAVVDLSLYSVGHGEKGKQYWFDLPSYDEFVVRCNAPSTTREGRIYDERYGMVDTLGLNDCRAINGYVCMPPLRHLKYDNINAWRVAQVQTISLWDPPSAELSAAGVGPATEGGWRTVPTPLPRVRFVSKAVMSTTPDADIRKISVDDTALVTHPMELTPSTPGEAKLIEDRPGRISVETKSPQRQLLILSESYYPDWKVRVDGQPASLEQVNGDFMGCVVEGGKHVVEFTFVSESLQLGRLVSLLSLSVLLIAVAVPAVGIFKDRS